MNIFKNRKRAIISVIEGLSIFLWTSILRDTDSFHSVYVLLAVFAVFCVVEQCRHSLNYMLKDINIRSVEVLSAVFSLAVVLANYPIFEAVQYPAMISTTLSTIINMVHLAVALIGGICVAKNITLYLIAVLQEELHFRINHNMKPQTVFLFSFLVIVCIDFAYLYLLEYPAHISVDSYSQITQAFTNRYIVIHPFWHTMLIKLCMTVGYAFFQDINAAAACYSVVQILFMGACFAYVIVTFWQANFPKWCIAACFAGYAFLPYNIALSITMWKDVPFSLAILLLTVSLFRIIRNIGVSAKTNHIVFMVGTALTCLMRTNGVASLAISALIMIPLLWRPHRRLMVLFVCVLILCGALTGIVSASVPREEIQYADLEPLSVPMQQIARVIACGYELTEEQIALVNQTISVEKVAELYVPWVIDPLKVALWESDLSYLNDHMDDYFKLWINLGIRYPWEYIKAWVEQTKGYWNGGYEYYQFAEMMYENEIGLEKISGNSLLVKIKYLYFGMFRFSDLFEILNSIGLHVWILALTAFINKQLRRKELVLGIPCLVIIAGLILGTPVYSEFRYVYPVFITLPVIVLSTIFADGNGNSDLKEPDSILS